MTLLNQDYSNFETIIVDDSPRRIAKEIAEHYRLKFNARGIDLKYVISKTHEGLPAARNLGIKLANGDIVLFLDDDTLLLGSDSLRKLAEFYEENPDAICVQPYIITLGLDTKKSSLIDELKNAAGKALMLIYRKDNASSVRRSGMPVLPRRITLDKIRVQRHSGVTSCRKFIYNEVKYDENLKLWAYMEDLDFSYRVFKRYPSSLYITSRVKILHKKSPTARLPSKTAVYMMTVYWFYIFFKDIYSSSLLNLTSFLYALFGKIVATIAELLVEKRANSDWLIVVWLLSSYALSLRNLKRIISRDLRFLNKKIADLTR